MLGSSTLGAGAGADDASSPIMPSGIAGDIDGGELLESGGGGGGGGNRWPRQETIDLLQIRSGMDAAFRDSSLKGPLWEDVSRKMRELGYHRSGKKCKEKFENVYKYHKRTKDGRIGKSEGKTYRFFDQLKVLEGQQSNSPTAFTPPQVVVPVNMVMPVHGPTTVPLSPQPISFVHVAPPPMSVTNTPPAPQQQYQQQNLNSLGVNHVQLQQAHVQLQKDQQQQAVAGQFNPIQMEHSGRSSDTPSSSSYTSSDAEVVVGSKKRKRKWQDFFEKLMKDVIEKQERLQKRFLEAVEKREHDRAVREEAWKMQEVARLNREHEILVKERSMAAAKDSALISFLQKLSEQQHLPLQLPVQLQPQPQTVLVPPVVVPVTQAQQIPSQHSQSQLQVPPQQSQSQQQIPPQQPQPQILKNQVPMSPPPLSLPQHVVAPSQTMVVLHNAEPHKTNNGTSPQTPSSSRWPKAEVEALINLRTNMDQKYQDQNCPKGPLWEEMSIAMKNIGYNRNAKRCKEKWENINKYFKKVKESNRKRPQDSKTCPYFEQLDALYRQKNNKPENTSANTNTNNANVNTHYAHPPSNLNLDLDHEDTDEDGDDDEDDEQGNGYEIVANSANANINAAGSMSTSSIATTTA